VAAPSRSGFRAGFFKRVHPDDLDATERAFRACADGTTPNYHARFRLTAPDGGWRWYEAWGQMFRDAPSGARMVGAIRDVDLEVEGEARASAANEQLRASEERYRTLSDQLEKRVAERTLALELANRELESFCYSVSHDLRAPLRSIDGFSLALLEDYGSRFDSEGKRLLDIVHSEAQRMGRLIDDLLNLSRMSRTSMTRTRVDLSALATACVATQRAAAPSRDVKVTIAPNMTAYGDDGLLHIVLENLVSNAWKFTRNRPDAHVEIGESDEHDGRSFYVRDNGAGFDMRYASKLFEPFQRLHPSADYEGNGVGLATVNRIISRHGGKVWAEGRPGEGAVFWWTLPGVEKATE